MENKYLKFLCKSRTQTYASGKEAEVISGFKVYSIKNGDLEYRDAYTDQHRYFQGQETIFQSERPIWSMSYRGAAEEGVDTGKVFSFLQKILKEHSDVVRLPGEKEYTDGDWKYIDHCEGIVEEFHGLEEIYQNGKLAHWMKYFGGEIK